MAQVFQTFEESLQSLQNPVVQYSTTPTASTAQQSNQPTAVAGVYTDQPAGQESAQQTTTPTSTQTYEAPSTGQLSLDSYNPTEISGAFGQLFNPIQQNIKQGYGALGEGVKSFNEAIGPSRNWASIGGEATIDKALAPSAQTSDRDAATKLFNNTWTAPTINSDTWQSAMDAYESARPAGKALTSAGSLEALMTGNEGFKNLTRGEVRKEAGDTWKNPAFAPAAQSIEQQVKDYYANIQRLQGESTALGAKRGEEEKGIRESAANALTTRYGAKESELQNKVAATQAQENAWKQAYDTYNSSDDYNAQIAALKKAGVDTTLLETDATKKYNEGTTKRQDILAKYPELGDPYSGGIPLMERSANSKGKETWRFPDEWYEANKGKYTKQQMADLKALARVRQIELVQAGFSPFYELVTEGTNKAGGEWSAPYFTPGQYGEMLPTYKVEDLKLRDTRPFVAPLEGSTIDPWSVASNEDYDYLNAIRGIRGEDTLVNQPDYVAPSVNIREGYGSALDQDLAQREQVIAEWYKQNFPLNPAKQGNWQGYGSLPKTESPPTRSQRNTPYTSGEDTIDLPSFAWELGAGGEGVYDYDITKDPVKMQEINSWLARGGF